MVFVIIAMMFIAYLQQMKLHNSGLYDYCGDTGTVGQFLLHPSNDTEYCDYTCLYVRLSLREHISGTAGPIGTKLLWEISPMAVAPSTSNISKTFNI